MSVSGKLIMVAAGRGRRLGNETEVLPKCMVAVAGRSMLHRALGSVAAAGVTDYVVVRGWQGHRITGEGQPLRFIENPDWARNNILASLFFAESEMAGGFFFSYSDIVYAPQVARTLATVAQANPQADVVLIIDRNWQEIYEGRTEHPLGEAELTDVQPGTDGKARVRRVGKKVVPAEVAAGEFIGLAYFTDTGARLLQKIWHDRIKSHGLEAPFGTAPRLEQAYLSDALNAMVDAGATLVPAFIEGRWREIDTGQDLARAASVVDTWE